MSDEWEFPDADTAPVEVFPMEKLSFPDAVHLSTPAIEDAVVIIPGIMGTELIDTTTGKLLWGLHPGLLARMWTARAKALAPLAVDPPDRPPRRIRPGRLVRVPVFAPTWGGAEPYARLAATLRALVRHPSAILEFGYDWRLPVRHNAALLAEAVEGHVRAWRIRSGNPDARVHLVAHSMGGLLCQALAAIPGATDDVGTTITLGTPFRGAAKAAVMIGTGEGTALPARRLREVAVTMPGLYDLLPTYRCVDEGGTVRALTAGDVAAFGGRGDLAAAAFADREALASVPIPEHRALIGVEQPTVCSLGFKDGRVEGLSHTFTLGDDGEVLRHPNGVVQRFAGRGDGTVPRTSAQPLHMDDPAPLPQQHGPIARVDEARAFVRDRLLHSPTGPWLGAGDLGIDPPDVVAVGTEFEIGITGVDGPHDIGTTLVAVETGTIVDAPHAQWRDGRLVVPTTVDQAGLYRIEVAGGGMSPVSQMVLAVTDPDRQ
ncbi:hypothetical protein EEB14_20860 [Rhodococcus sp. WS4]|nr:hypothetical protein EEB14_20860 [Rhodococcus sp. WS4]